MANNTRPTEHCLYCGNIVDGNIRSPHGNPMCKEHYNQIYEEQKKDSSWMDGDDDDMGLHITWHNMRVPNTLKDILMYIDWKCPSNTFCRMTKEDIECFINWLGEIKHPVYYEFCSNEDRFNVIAKEVIIR